MSCNSTKSVIFDNLVNDSYFLVKLPNFTDKITKLYRAKYHSYRGFYNIIDVPKNLIYNVLFDIFQKLPSIISIKNFR